MRKIMFISLIAFLFCLVGCKEKPVDTENKKLFINYYDEDNLITREKYEEQISLIDYSKDGYTFKGWFLDQELTNQFDENKTNEYFNQKSINLYAKMERIMEALNLQIKGSLENNKYVLNPAFTWNKTSGQHTYKVSLFLNGEEKEKTETFNNYYQVKAMLSPNTSYELKVTCENGEESISFETGDAITSSITSISVVNPYSNDMVIQRNVENKISGKGPENQLLTMTVGSEAFFTIANDKGEFEFSIPAKEASFTPVDIRISNGLGAAKAITNVLFGDVFLFAGQSNMQWETIRSDYSQSDINDLVNSTVRFFCQDITTSTTKLESVKNGRWFVPTSTNCNSFSAIATMTASMLGTALKNETPIGIVTAYQGDTNIANWMGSEYYHGTCSTKYLHYNAMVYPLRHTKLSGVVWYQGCNNSAAGCEYKGLLLDLFRNYRELFNTANLPFYVIGLACYDGDSGNNFDFSYVRESQALACALDENAYFISTCDDGDPTYIHPSTKRYICERVSKSIQASIYGKDYFTEGPSYNMHTVDGNVVTIKLNNSEGLYAKGEIKGLYLAGIDGKYYEAQARIENNQIIASSTKVTNPVYIKYGFGKSPFVNIFNKDNFAITPFRTDELNTNIDLFDYSSVADYYFHPDGSQMEVSLNNGHLVITKKADGKGYGSIRLNKWGAVIYQPEGFEFTIKGSNSGASIAIRFIEGDSNEIWGYKIIDDFEGEKTFNVGVGDFIVMYNKQNNVFEPQKISYVEVMVETNSSATFELCGAKFVHVDRSKPMNFTISSASEQDDTVTVVLSNALFANNYTLVIKKGDSQDALYSKEQEDTVFIIDKSLFEVDSPYYLSAVAKNELGETDAMNSGFVFYLKDERKLIVCNFDFQNQAALDAYINSSMSVHDGLHCILQDNGVKIESTGKGWQQFIFKLETGIAAGMTKMEFYADFTNYNGSVILQLADTSWGVYQYDLDLSAQKEGIFTIDFNKFLKSGTPFTTQNLMWVMFNFSDSVGNGYILFDDLVLMK